MQYIIQYSKYDFLLIGKNTKIFGTIIAGENIKMNLKVKIKEMRSFLFGVFFILWGVAPAMAQSRVSAEKDGYVVAYKMEQGDTVYFVHLQTVVIRAPRKFKNAADERQFWRLVYNVKKVYPYAKLAGKKLHELNERYLEIKSEKDRKAYSKQTEDELKAEFEGELRKLTVTQGRILLRLVDRETGNTTYEILQDFRGSLSAVFWQAIARVFGSNLKTRYDPSSGEDKTIEQIIAQIEEGSI